MGMDEGAACVVVFLFKRTSQWERDAGAGEWGPRPDAGLGPDVQALGLQLLKTLQLTKQLNPTTS
jgi:hypothetical protein